MTQNLDLDIPASGLSAKDTDIESDWSGSSTYPPEETRNKIDFTYVSGSSIGGAAQTYSWNLGDYYINDPTSNVACANIGTSGSLASCSRATPLSFALSSTDALGKEELHYHIGNFYQWNVAVAGCYANLPDVSETTNGTLVNADNSSICPKGWKLPTGADTLPDSFVYLSTQYDAGTAVEKLVTKPLYYARSGWLFPAASLLESTGTEMAYWTKTGAKANARWDAVSFAMRETYLSYDTQHNAFVGGSVRCLAR